MLGIYCILIKIITKGFMKKIHRYLVPIGNSNLTVASSETMVSHPIESVGNIETTMKVFNKTNVIILNSDLNDRNKFLST